MPCLFRNIQDSKPENCGLHLEVYVPPIDACTPKINSQGRCIVAIHKEDWNKSNGLVVRHDDNGIYALHHDYEIHLRTVPPSGAKMWRGITLSPIKVCIKFCNHSTSNKSHRVPQTNFSANLNIGDTPQLGSAS